MTSPFRVAMVALREEHGGWSEFPASRGCIGLLI